MDPLIPQGLTLPLDHLKRMQDQVTSAYPEEACGLIAGIEGISLAVYPITNELHSPVRFRLDPQEQLEAFMDIEAKGWDVLAVYHSHPRGPESPSQTDIDEFAYPGILYLIWSLEGLTWQCRGYEIEGTEISEISLTIIS